MTLAACFARNPISSLRPTSLLSIPTVKSPAAAASKEAIIRAGQEGADSVAELKSISQKVKSQIAVIYEQTNTTNESAQEIHKATELIASIANETNLLALNASIEAARALI